MLLVFGLFVGAFAFIVGLFDVELGITFGIIAALLCVAGFILLALGAPLDDAFNGNTHKRTESDNDDRGVTSYGTVANETKRPHEDPSTWATTPPPRH